MPTWPSELDYSTTSYGWSVTPDVVTSVSLTGLSRSRPLRIRRDDVFTINMRLTASELETFEDFVKGDLENGTLYYDAPIYTSDVPQTVSLRIINGEYSVTHLHTNYYEVNMNVELSERLLSQEQLLYEIVIEHGGFEQFWGIIEATEDAVNANNL